MLTISPLALVRLNLSVYFCTSGGHSRYHQNFRSKLKPPVWGELAM